MLPQQYTGDLRSDKAMWDRTWQYANDSGYIQAYGIRAGIVFAARAIAEIDAERLAATASPTAAALAAAEAQHGELARQQAAAARAVGAGAMSHAPPPPPPVKPAPRDASGSLKPPEQYIREMQEYIAAGGA
jgi:hypothetical protein